MMALVNAARKKSKHIPPVLNDKSRERDVSQCYAYLPPLNLSLRQVWLIFFNSLSLKLLL